MYKKYHHKEKFYYGKYSFNYQEYVLRKNYFIQYIHCFQICKKKYFKKGLMGLARNSKVVDPSPHALNPNPNPTHAPHKSTSVFKKNKGVYSAFNEINQKFKMGKRNIKDDLVKIYGLSVEPSQPAVQAKYCMNRYPAESAHMARLEWHSLKACVYNQLAHAFRSNSIKDNHFTLHLNQLDTTIQLHNDFHVKILSFIKPYFDYCNTLIFIGKIKKSNNYKLLTLNIISEKNKVTEDKEKNMRQNMKNMNMNDLKYKLLLVTEGDAEVGTENREMDKNSYSNSLHPTSDTVPVSNNTETNNNLQGNLQGNGKDYRKVSNARKISLKPLSKKRKTSNIQSKLNIINQMFDMEFDSDSASASVSVTASMSLSAKSNQLRRSRAPTLLKFNNPTTNNIHKLSQISQNQPYEKKTSLANNTFKFYEYDGSSVPTKVETPIGLMTQQIRENFELIYNVKGNEIKKQSHPLSRLVYKLFDYNGLKIMEKLRYKLELVTSLFDLIQTLDPDVHISIYGSFCTGLCLHTSDVDIVLNYAARVEKKDSIGKLTEIYHALRDKANPKDIELITTAKVPVVKCNMYLPLQGLNSAEKNLTENTLPVDISIVAGDSYHAGQQSVLFISYLKNSYPHFVFIVVLVKMLLNQYNLNSTFYGGLGSYSIVLLCGFFLELGRYNNPNFEALSTGEVFREFLRDWIQFDFAHQVIYFQDSYFNCYEAMDNTAQMTVLDPCNYTNNTAVSCQRLDSIIKVFKDLLELLQKNDFGEGERGERDGGNGGNEREGHESKRAEFNTNILKYFKI